MTNLAKKKIFVPGGNGFVGKDVVFKIFVRI